MKATKKFVSFTAIALIGLGGLATGVASAAPVQDVAASACDASQSPKLRQDDSGAAVKALQCLLNERVDAGLEVDGRFGPDTDTAVRGFQRAQGLAVDGVVGSDTWAALEKDTAGKTIEQRRQAALDYAEDQLGKPYVFGADGPDSFDCSGLTLRSMQAAGVTDIPRVSDDQGAKYKVSASDRQVGDIIHIPGHVGLYAGDGKVLHASGSRKEVIIEDMNWGSSATYHRYIR